MSKKFHSMLPFLLTAYHLCLSRLYFVLFSFFCVLSTFLVVSNNRPDVVKQLQHNVLDQRIKIKFQRYSAVQMMIMVTNMFLLCCGLLLRCSISVLHGNNDCYDCYDFHYKCRCRWLTLK